MVGDEDDSGWLYQDNLGWVYVPNRSPLQSGFGLKSSAGFGLVLQCITTVVLPFPMVAPVLHMILPCLLAFSLVFGVQTQK